MCAIRHFDKKTRRIYAAANVCLLMGLIPALFLNGWRASHPGVFDGVRGFALGTAIGLFLWVLWRKRACVEAESGKR